MTVLKDTADRMIEALDAHRAELEQDSRKIYPLVEQILLPRFDFRLMARWALGKHWRLAKPDQRDRFVTEFRTFLVSTYGKSLLAYSGETIRYLSVQPGKKNRVTARTEIQAPGAPVIPVHYSMHQVKNGDWKIYDVKVDGISLVMNYRNSFAEQIKREGMDALIAKLNKRNVTEG